MDKARTISLCIIVIDHVYNRKKWYNNPTCTRPKIGFLNSTTNLMAWESFDGLVLSNLANMYRAISGTCCKRNIVSPIDIQSWSWKILLSWLTSYRSRNLTDTLKRMLYLNEIQTVVSIPHSLCPTQLQFYPHFHSEDNHLLCSTSEKRLALYVWLK